MSIDVERARQILALPEFESQSKQLRDVLGDDWPDADASGLTAKESEEFEKLVEEADSQSANNDLADWIEEFLERRSSGNAADSSYQQATENPNVSTPIYQGSAIIRELVAGIDQYTLDGVEVFRAGELGTSSEYYYDRALNTYDTLGNPLTTSEFSAAVTEGQPTPWTQQNLAAGATGIYIDTDSRLFLEDSTEVWESEGLYYDRQGNWWDSGGQPVMSGGGQAEPGEHESGQAAADVYSIMNAVIAENPGFSEIPEERRLEIAHMALKDLGLA